MRKILVVLCVAGFIVSLASPLMAGGIINKQNLSSEYLRTFSRNAATDAADITVFNPAGVMKMENGWYGDLGIFHADKEYSNTVPVLGEFDSDEPSIVPGLFVLHKQDKWAGFFAFTIPGGGGKVDYKDGNVTTLGMAQAIMALTPYDTIESMSIEANSFYYGYTFGGAYAINDTLSVSGGLRFVDAFKEADGTVELSVGGLGATPINVKFEQTTSGWGAFLGLNYTPREDLNFGFRYETATKLDFESNIKNDDTGGLAGTFDPRLIDGNRIQEDLPGIIGLGAAYKVNPNIKLDLSLTYYLEKSAGFEDNSRLEDVDDSWDLAISGEYTFNPQLRASAGYMYTKTGIDADDMMPENPELGANTLCAGVAWEPKDNMTLNFAILNSFYDSDKTSTGIKLEKNVFGLGFGIEYKFK